MIIKKFLFYLINNAVKRNDKKIIDLLEIREKSNYLDLGCDDGEKTIKMAKKINTKNIFGVEIVEQRILEAKNKGIAVSSFDLNKKFLYQDNYFDIITSDQVIEHLYNTDNFIFEIYRLLKPGGYAIISTENLSSWHNVFSLILGFQPFSMANFSSKGSVGNPFSLWKNNENEKTKNLTSWQHNRLFSFFALKDVFRKFGFKVEKICTSGYYPLPGFFSKIDPVHGHFITIKVRKI